MDLFQLKGQRSAHQGESDKELQRKSQFIENYDDQTELRFRFKMLSTER